MNIDLNLLLFIIIFVALGVVIFLLLRKKGSGSENLLVLMEKLAHQSEKLSQLSSQNSEIRQELDRKLSETHSASQAQFGQTY